MKQTLTSESFALGQIIREPVGDEPGYWVGEPGAFYAADEKTWYLSYRIRRPHGVAPDRGGEARIARSTDLKNWEDIWSVTKDAYGSASIERSTVRKGADDQWRYFTSYVDPADGRWCTAMLKAPSVRELDPAQCEVIFTAPPLGLEGVKDPWIFEERGVFHMFLSVAVATPKTKQDSHATLDIYNTGECVSATGLATSLDLDHWKWQGIVFRPDDAGWDKYCRRINSVVPLGGKYFAFYDGSASHQENYEEKTGLADSTGLRQWQTLTPNGPKLTSPHSSASLRYIDAKLTNGEWHIFYEFARPDGAHDMRVMTCDAVDLPF